VYGPTNGDTGADTKVSGTVFSPEGEPPPGGWPIIALGIEEHGAPSESADL
jgi:hypothetical protein